MRKYISFFQIRFSNGIQYRAAAYAGVITQFAWGAMNVLMFYAFYQGNPESFPMTLPQLVAYIWLQQAFLGLFMVWFFEEDIFQAITSGNVAYELVRPMDLYSMWFVKNMASRVSKTVLRCMPILLVAIVLPEPFRLPLPVSSSNLCLFILSLILGLFVIVSLCMLVYVLCFFTLSPLGVRMIFVSLAEILSGGLIPIPFMPKSIGKIVELLPFASIQDVSLRIYSGNLQGNELVLRFCVQVFWVIALVSLGKIGMRKVLKKSVIQGG